MTAEDAAQPVVDILRTVEAADERIESLTRQVYAIRMAVLKIAWEKKVWEQFEDEEVGQPFRSGDRWLKVTFPKSWRYCREALATANKLPDVPMEKLVDTPRCNILTLTQVSSSVRSLPDVLHAAHTLSGDQFVSILTTEHGQALERPVTLKLTYPAGDMEQVKTYLRWVAGKADLEPDDYAGALLYLSIHENAEHAAD
jgi:hypothetical protein